MDEMLLSKANDDKINCLLPDYPKHAPLSLRDVATQLDAAATTKARHDAVLMVYICLQQHGFQTSDPSAMLEACNKDDDVPRQTLREVNPSLLHFLIKSLIKCLTICPTEFGVSSPQDYMESSLITEAGLASLFLLSRLHQNPEAHYDFADEDLLSIIPFTDKGDPWSTEKSAKYAESLISQYLTHDRRTNVVVQSLLQRTIRPLFSISSALLTSSGRPSQFGRASETAQHRINQVTPCWKSRGCYVISSLRFAVKSDSALITSHWPLFIPAIIALAEDEAAPVREQGLQIMELFLARCPANLVHSTGIDIVFRNTVFPALLFLPTLTPEKDSLNLLRPAYRVLLRLAKLEPHLPNPQKQQLLDKIIRDGILAGYSHASQHIHIIHVLMDFTELAVDYMGVFAVKHLQSLLRLFSSVMEDPFAVLHPPTIVSAAKALQATLINCWPRFSNALYAEQVINTIVQCWLNMDDGIASSKLTRSDREEISQHLIQIGKVVQSLWKQQNYGSLKKLQNMITMEPRLAEFFKRLELY